jgi:hypothetical protein
LDLKESLKNSSKKCLLDDEAGLVLTNMISRRRFLYTGKDILEFLARCFCLRSMKFAKFSGPREEWNMIMRKHYHYKEGEDKLFDELDVISLLKAIRRVKLLTQTLLSQR